MSDKTQAITWYLRAAQQNHVDAQYNLGILFYHGDAIEQNQIEAIKWFRKAALQGSVAAEKMLKDIGDL